jgi:hypothetical protein
MDDDGNPPQRTGEDRARHAQSSNNHQYEPGNGSNGIKQGAADGQQLPAREEDGEPCGRTNGADDAEGSTARKRSRSAAAAQGGGRPPDAAGAAVSSSVAHGVPGVPRPPRAPGEAPSIRQGRTTVDDDATTTTTPRGPLSSPRAATSSAFNVPNPAPPSDAAGYASNGVAGFHYERSVSSYTEMAALLAYAREREAVLARERERALHLALLNHHHHQQQQHQQHQHQLAGFPANLGHDPSTLPLLLLSASLRQGHHHHHHHHHPPPPPNLYPLSAWISPALRSQAQLSLLGYTVAPPTTHPPPPPPARLALLPDIFRQGEGLHQQVQARQSSFAPPGETLLGSHVASAAPALPSSPPPSRELSAGAGRPHGEGRQAGGSSGLVSSLSSEEQKEEIGRPSWPTAGTSFRRILADPPTDPRPLSINSRRRRPPPPPALDSSDIMSSTPPAAHNPVLISCRFYERAIPVSLPEDAHSTSRFQALLREQVLYVEAVQVDVQASTQGRNRPIRMGQVGILCRHCRNIPPRNRPRGAMYFPQKLLSIYQSAQNMANHHYGASSGCPNAPDEINEALRTARSDKSIVYGGGQQYWARSASASGLVETDAGLAFVVSRTASDAALADDAAAPSSSPPASP